MIFSISSTLLVLSTLASALPTIEKRQSRSIRSGPVEVLKLYEHSPDVVTPQDGWGETSRIGNGLTGVNTLVAFQTYPEDAGKTCNLRFAPPSIQTLSRSFTLWSFIPSNGKIFDPHKATWNSKTGYRDQQLATHTHVLNGPDIVYSLPCPSGGKILNYELTSANGESNMQWYAPNGEGLYLEVATAVNLSPSTPIKGPITIAQRDQAQMFEARPTSGSGSIQFGEVSATKAGVQTTTLVAYVMPDGPDYSKRQCRLRFSNPTESTGSKTFALFEFIPYDGRVIFQSDRASWNSKGGYRNRQLAMHVVGDNKAAVTVYSFPCPAPGKGLNYELVPSNGEVKIAWNTQGNPKGGLALEVV